MTSNKIREKFLNFFQSKGHRIVPSAPMVIKDDPTLMFTNAGMNQFKDWFLGNSPIEYPRVANSQKCLRVSGKHNDLEEVGHDTYHHTMFEMLGNWSFGDYFKREAIEWAWELLTKEYGLDPKRLYATVFEGSEEDRIVADSEARDEWLKFLPKERVLNGNKKDNFWEMGESGPCGPCSELHIDLRSDQERSKIDGATLVNKDHPLVVEIWNLVFIQYNRRANGTLVALPNKHVDTGMGLERLTMALQNKQSNYETDLFTGMIDHICELTKKEYNSTPEVGVAMRVIADHIRAIAFSIADGQLPSNVKAGYVIRRILRRAVRYAYTFLECTEPLLHKLVVQLVKDMGSAFPELIKQQSLIERVIREEEEAFLRTLDKGIRLLESIMKREAKNKKISGKDAFTLYDTYGFPLDLSQLIAKESGYTIDQAGFEAELQKQKQRSREVAASQEGDWVELLPYSGTLFTGYESVVEQANIVRYRVVKYKNRELYHIVLDRTPFYAESGGQVGDSGVMESESGKVVVVNTIKENNLHIHITHELPTNPSLPITAKVDIQRRVEIANNHTATHLLHNALRTVLGNHIEQKGSLVSNSYFRFDFSHFEKLSDQELKEVEELVNANIRANQLRNEVRDVPIDEAKKMGAIALFGEKYGESARVIKFGGSIELCGGIHTSATGNIGLFKIVSESAIAAGVRRVEAVTGLYAQKIVNENETLLKEIKQQLNNTPNILTAIEKLVGENELLKKRIEEMQREQALNLKETILSNATIINGITLYQLKKGEYSQEVVKNLAFMLRKESDDCAFIAAFTDAGKPFLNLAYSDNLVKKGKNASGDIRLAASHIKGGGGGQPFFASAGGKEPAGIDCAMEKLIECATTTA